MNSTILSKVMKAFIVMWVVFAVGLAMGPFIPESLILPLIIVQVVLFLILLVMGFMGMVKQTKLLLYLFVFLLGPTMYWAVGMYINELGKEVVLLVFASTAVIFVILGIIGLKIKKDLSSWGNYLFAALIALIIFSIAFMFLNPSNLIMVIFSLAGVLIFVLYTVYDFNRIAKGHVSEEEVHWTAFSLFIDFINLFLDILRAVYYIKKMFED